MSLKRKLGIHFAVFVTFILIITNALYYFSTRDLLVTDQQKQMELLAKEISISIEHTQLGNKYMEVLISERLRTVAIAAQDRLDPDIRNVTNEQLIALSQQLGVSAITLLVKDGDDIKGVKSSDPKERDLSTKQWGYWFTAFQQLFDYKNATIPEGHKMANYWSGPMNVSASDPNHVDKFGYYHDGTTNYIIDPYMRDTQIKDFIENVVGPNAIVKKTLKSNNMILSIAGFNPRTFGEPPVYYEQNGVKFITLENQELSFGQYLYQQKERDKQGIKDASKTGQPASFVTTIDGSKVLKTFIPIPDDNPYVIGIVTDYKFIQDVMRQQLLNQLLVSLVVLLAVYIGSYFLAGYIVRPITHIVRKVNEIAKGNFGVYAEIRRNDELGILAERVNAMSQNLEAYTRELEEKSAEIAYHANYDFLTGLPNRRLFNEQIIKAMDASGLSAVPLAVMFIDLDRFKSINDVFGHSVGDYILRSVAARLLSCFNQGEMVCRISGDEFVVVVPDGNAEIAAHKAQLVLDQLSRPFHYEKEELFVTCSIGISLYPTDGDNVETIVRNADVAMYRAKEQGRNRYQLYLSAMNADLIKKSVLEKQLRKALERKELVLFYQPQIDLTTGEIVGSEALLRWEHPEFGLVSPDEFISLAEETGLIVPIGEWVIRAACEQNKKWQAAGGPRISVSVNLSARQFQQKNLVESIKKALADSGLDPKYLKLEITESIAMYNEDYVIDKLQTLKNSGIAIAIDDFGLGYSSLNYLKKFPIDTLKIDKSFVGDIMNDSDNEEIIKTIIAMARNLNVNVIAEGVETEPQLSFLRAHKCNEAQGYLFSKPLSGEQFEAMFAVLKETAAAKINDEETTR